MEHELRATTDSWNIVGHINGTKCVACKKTANNAEVLRCCKCKLMYHVVNCSEVDKDVLPPPSSLKLYIKFANKDGIMPIQSNVVKAMEYLLSNGADVSSHSYSIEDTYDEDL